MATSTKKTLGLLLLIILIFFAMVSIGRFMMIPGCTVLFGLDGAPKVPLLHHMTYSFGFPFARLVPTLLIFAIWLIVILWVYSDAERRGMSGVLWALLVLVGNLIGLIIYLIVRAGNYPMQPASVPVGGQIVCPTCSKPVREDFVMCPHCGVSLKEKCTSCQRNIAPEWKICPYCGHNLK